MATVITLPATSTPEYVVNRLMELAGDAYVVAVEVFDHPGAMRVPDGARYGADMGRSDLGAWVLGREADVYAHIAQHGWVSYAEQYGEGPLDTDEEN